MDAHARLNQLPKAEHHLHIEGCIPWAMVRASSDTPLPDTPKWAATDYRFDDFDTFNDVISYSSWRVFTALDAYHRVATHHFQHLARQNVRYVEVSFHLAHAPQRGYRYEDMIHAIVSAAPPDMTVRVFGAFHRMGEFADDIVQAILNTPNLTGIDLHGDERTGSIDPFIDIFAEARRLGLRTKAHAGELRDAQSITETLDKLKPQCIQHGITAHNDAHLLQRLADDGVVLDVCPTSNIKLCVMPDIATYPLRAFLQAGVAFTINTDDPAIFNCTLTGELKTLVDHNVLSLREVANLQRAAFQRASLSPAQRATLLHEIDEHIAALA